MLKIETFDNVTIIEEVPDIKEQVTQALLDTGRTGMQRLLDYMEQAGYYEAPASCAAHMADTGGLAQHSWHVMELAQKLNLTLDCPCDDDSIVLCALLHDLGKCGQFDKQEYIENILENGKQSSAKPYKINKELRPIDHETRSALEAYRYLPVTEDELYAILHHNGVYGSKSKTKNVQNNEGPLDMIIHFADLWCSRVTDKEYTKKENVLH